MQNSLSDSAMDSIVPSSSIPSAPTKVVTTGTPSDRHFNTFNFIPAPFNKGNTPN